MRYEHTIYYEFTPELRAARSLLEQKLRDRRIAFERGNEPLIRALAAIDSRARKVTLMTPVKEDVL